MAAPREDPRESVRIRIKFDINKTIMTKVSRKYWMLVQESSSLSTISDLQLQIVNRFHLASNSIQLCLEHFLLPSWESVRILRENDLLSVQDIDAVKNETHVQLTPNLRENVEQPDLQSCTDEQTAVELTTRKKKKKKRKRYHSESDDITMDFQEARSHDTQLLRMDEATMKQKVQCLNGTGVEEEDQYNKESATQQQDAVQTVTEQMEKCLADAKSKQKNVVTELVVKREHLKEMQVDPLKQCDVGGNGSVRIEETVADDTVKTKKKRRRRHKPRRTLVDTPADIDNNLNLPSPQATMQKPVKILPAKKAHKGHVHFDSDMSEDDAGLVGDVVSNDSRDNVDSKMDMAAMTDIQSANTECSQEFAPQLSVSQSSGTGREVDQLVNGNSSVKVFYRGKPSSKALPSMEFAVTIQKSVTSPNVVVEVKEKDYSVYDLLHGPPRPGDKIAYKLLELSETYNPEVSSYKEAQVISFDPSTQTLEVEKLGAPTVVRKPGKFDVVVEDDNEILTTTEESILKVNLSWPSLIEARLLT